MVARADVGAPYGRPPHARGRKGQLPSYCSTGSLDGTGPGPDLSTGPDQDMTMSWPCLVRVLVVSQSCPGRVRATSRTGGLRPHSVHCTQVRSTVRWERGDWTGTGPASGTPPGTYGGTSRLQQSAVRCVSTHVTSGSTALSRQSYGSNGRWPTMAAGPEGDRLLHQDLYT